MAGVLSCGCGAGVVFSGCGAGAGVSAAGALLSGCGAGAGVSAAGVLLFGWAAGVVVLPDDLVPAFAVAEVFPPALLFVELPVGSPAFQVSEAGTLKEISFPSAVAMMVPSSSVRYTATPFVRRVFKVSA